MIEDQPMKFLLPVCVLIGTLYFFNLEQGHVFGGDFSQYIEQSQALIQGTTEDLFEANVFTMEHSDRNIGPYLYPIGFPLIITPVTLLFGLDFKAYKTLLLFFFLLASIMTWKLFKNKFTNPRWPLIISLLLLFNYYFVVYLDIIGSDIPFLFFALLSIYFIENYRKSEHLFWQLIIGLSVLFAFLIRTSGISILFSLFFIHIVEDFQQIRAGSKSYLRENYLRYIPYLVFLVGLLINNVFYIQGEQNHLAILTGASFSKAISNLIFYTGELKLFLVLYYPRISFLLLILSLPFVTAGIYYRWKKDLLYLAFVAATLAIYAIWPEQENVRFMFPVVPFYFYFLIRGLLKVNELKPRWKLTFIPGILLLLVIIQGLFYSIRDIGNKNSTNVLSESATEAFEFVRNNSAESDLFIFSAPRTFRLMTDRNAIAISSPVQMLQSTADYMLTRREVPPDYRQFKKIFSNDEFKVYKIVKNHSAIK